MKKTILGLVLIFASGIVFGQQGYAYTVVDGKSVTIIGYIGNDATLDIPAQIQGLPVTSIDDTTWNISNRNLKIINIPSSVTFINERAFSFVESLTTITVDSRNPAYTSVDGVLFDKNIRTIIAYPISRTTRTYTIPSTVTTIANRAFNHSSLTSITIPSSVTSIGEWAISFTNLTSITIPSSVTSIGGWAFCSSQNLTSVTILSSVIAIGNDAFSSCERLTNVTLSRRAQVGENAFPEKVRITYRD